MNERIKELAEQAGFDDVTDYKYECRHEQLERFAELVAAHEREACAKLYEELSKANWTFCNFAEAIRARSKHD